jgi:hypothetical protein
MWPGIDSSYKIKSQSDHGATSVDEMKIAKAWDILAARSHKKKKKSWWESKLQNFIQHFIN